MKKICCIILSLVLIFSLSACSKEEEKKKEVKNAVDLEYYAKLGKIPEVEYTLGTDVDKAEKELSKAFEEELENHQADPYDAHDHDETVFYFEKIEGEKNVLLDNGHILYYYNKANKDKGISYIVNTDVAFGFKRGTIISEIKTACPKIKFTEEAINTENAFFAVDVQDGQDNGTVLSAEYKGTVISFFFKDNALFATSIHNGNWSY